MAWPVPSCYPHLFQAKCDTNKEKSRLFPLLAFRFPVFPVSCQNAASISSPRPGARGSKVDENEEDRASIGQLAAWILGYQGRGATVGTCAVQARGTRRTWGRLFDSRVAVRVVCVPPRCTLCTSIMAIAFESRKCLSLFTETATIEANAHSLPEPPSQQNQIHAS